LPGKEQNEIIVGKVMGWRWKMQATLDSISFTFTYFLSHKSPSSKLMTKDENSKWSIFLINNTYVKSDSKLDTQSIYATTYNPGTTSIQGL
jgi:hypothetical protein